MKGKKSQREVYDKNYYKVQELLANPKFKRQISDLKRKFQKFNCPIPKNGFNSMQEYLDWNKNKFWKSYSDLETSEKYKKEIIKITGGKSSWGSEEMLKIERFREKFLPPVYGQVFEDILEEFGISRKNKGFDDFLERHVFFNKNTYPTSLLTVKWIRNKKTDKMELFIQIYGHTRKEDLMKNWDFIIEDQKLLPDYTGKNKKWFTFNRDNLIYETYLKIKEGRSTRSSKKLKPIDEEIYLQMQDRYPGLTMGTIRSIVSKVKEFRVASKDTH